MINAVETIIIRVLKVHGTDSEDIFEGYDNFQILKVL